MINRKLKQIHTIALTLSLFILCQCNQNKQQKNSLPISSENPPVTVKVPHPESIDFTELFDSLRFIPIRIDNDAPLIADVYQIKLIEKYICLFDELNAAVHILNQQGRLINAFYREEESPGKFQAVEDFDISGDTLFIYERERKRILSYQLHSKEYLGYKNVPILFLEFSRLGNLYFTYADDDSFPIESAKRGKLQVYSKSFDSLLYSGFPYIPVRDDIDNPQIFFPANGIMYFSDIHSDSIISFNKEIFNPEYLIDFGSRKIPSSLIQNFDIDIFFNALSENSYMGLKHYLMVDDDILAFWFREGVDQRLFLFETSSSKATSVDILHDNIHGGEIPYPMTYDPKKNHFVSTISREQIIRENKLTNSQNTNLKEVFQDEIDDYLIFYKVKSS